MHVNTKDTKFLCPRIGGALVTIKDAQTSELLAKGVTRGRNGTTGMESMTVNLR